MRERVIRVQGTKDVCGKRLRVRGRNPYGGERRMARVKSGRREEYVGNKCSGPASRGTVFFLTINSNGKRCVYQRLKLYVVSEWGPIKMRPELEFLKKSMGARN